MSTPAWTLGEIAELAEGTLRHGGDELAIEYGAISSDTRTLESGDFFVALRGNSSTAIASSRTPPSGAVRALVDAPLDRSWPQVVVEDSLAGWQRWGASHRRRWNGRIVAVTGSSGRRPQGPARAPARGRGSLVDAGQQEQPRRSPWTLLGLSGAHRFAVIEMGMNHPGEIALLSRLTRPDVALITSVGRAHIGHLGSREAILSAKLEIETGLAPDAPLILPEDPWILNRLPDSLRDRPRCTFGLAESADWHPEGEIVLGATGTRFRTRRTGTVELSLLGIGAVLSALGALAAVDALGEDPARLAPRLATAPRHPMRMEPRSAAGAQWILDCYNASPESSRLAIEFLRTVPHAGRRVLVLGALAELGDASPSIHRELGALVTGIDAAVFVGVDAKPAFETCQESSGVDLVHWSATREDASNWLAEMLRAGDLVLLKAARRLALERILERFTPGSASRVEG
ncbi:MAG: Mur ligase family protein [Candidatus Eisenbacteria bacterium]